MIGILIEELGVAVSMSLGVLAALVTSVLVLWTGRVVTLRSVPHKPQNSQLTHAPLDGTPSRWAPSSLRESIVDASVRLGA